MNIAYIDGQNLFLGVRDREWQLDFKKFRVYLAEKYGVERAHYFLGQRLEGQEGLYEALEGKGYELIFRLHTEESASSKKGNIDTDLVFKAMRDSIKEEELDKVVIVSGDGDFRRMIDYFIEEGRFLKLLAPNGRYSSLYKDIVKPYVSNISSDPVKSKLLYEGKKTSEKN
jgi:uncharacterized LabA/DUF88 family protein